MPEVYEGIVPLVADDVADQVIYAATRPRFIAAWLLCSCGLQGLVLSVLRCHDVRGIGVSTSAEIVIRCGPLLARTFASRGCREAL